MKRLIADAPPLDGTDASGGSALYWAAQNGHTEIVKALLLRGADIDAQTSYGYTALMIAALNGHGGCVAGLARC